jgi:hypothetical protein
MKITTSKELLAASEAEMATKIPTLTWGLLEWAYQNIPELLDLYSTDSDGRKVYNLEVTEAEARRLKAEDASVRTHVTAVAADRYIGSGTRGWRFTVKQNNTNDPKQLSHLETKAACYDLRREIKAVGSKINILRKSDFSNEPGTDRGEIIANITLAYRHLEDSALRLGKAIQELDGGTSVYDKA